MSQGVVKILKERVNKLVPRRELVVEVDHAGTGTPARQQIAEMVKSTLALSGNSVVVVRKVLTDYGTCTTRASIHIYESFEKAREFEPTYILKRNGLIKEEAAAQPQQG
ncbi:MAG: 30S ribosomal protein S24e [Infirmifilum sp.]